MEVLKTLLIACVPAVISGIISFVLAKSQSSEKTLTTPSWLNEAAETAHLNFSSVLQAGLKNQLQIE